MIPNETIFSSNLIRWKNFMNNFGIFFWNNSETNLHLNSQKSMRNDFKWDYCFLFIIFISLRFSSSWNTQFSSFARLSTTSDYRQISSQWCSFFMDQQIKEKDLFYHKEKKRFKAKLRFSFCWCWNDQWEWNEIWICSNLSIWLKLEMTIADNTIDIDRSKSVGLSLISHPLMKFFLVLFLFVSFDWFIDRRHCPKDWNQRSITIRAKIDQSLEDLPQDDQIQWLSDSSRLSSFSLRMEQTFSFFSNRFGLFFCFETGRNLKTKTEKETKNKICREFIHRNEWKSNLNHSIDW